MTVSPFTARRIAQTWRDGVQSPSRHVSVSSLRFISPFHLFGGLGAPRWPGHRVDSRRLPRAARLCTVPMREGLDRCIGAQSVTRSPPWFRGVLRITRLLGSQFARPPRAPPRPRPAVVAPMQRQTRQARHDRHTAGRRVAHAAPHAANSTRPRHGRRSCRRCSAIRGIFDTTPGATARPRRRPCQPRHARPRPHRRSSATAAAPQADRAPTPRSTEP